MMAKKFLFVAKQKLKTTVTFKALTINVDKMCNFLKSTIYNFYVPNFN